MSPTLYFDGACEPRNPGGTATYGWLIVSNGTVLRSGRGVAAQGEQATNNLAEYTALVEGLKALIELGTESATIKGDSQLVINQITGVWHCNAANLRPLLQQVSDLASQLKSVRFLWVPREKNEQADQLSKEAYKDKHGNYPPVRHKWKKR